MRLPHESQNDRIKYTYSIKKSGVGNVGGLQMPKEESIELRAFAEFNGETFVPTDDYELLRRIGKSAADGLAERPAFSPDLLPQVWELTRSIAGVVKEKFDWWSGLRARSEVLGFDMDNFMEPPVDVLRLTPKNNPSVIFDFLNFGLEPFSEAEIRSAHNVFSRALRGVDLSNFTVGERSILIVPSVVAFIQMTDLVAYIDEDILKIFGQGGDNATLERYSDMLRSCFFTAGKEVDVSGLNDPEVDVEVLPYQGEWGLKAPSEITFDLVDIT